MTLSKIWQGYLDSNQGMTGSKPVALPLGDSPAVCSSDLSMYIVVQVPDIRKPTKRWVSKYGAEGET